MNTTFTTTSGTTFTANESNTYFYAIWTENGKQTKKRISKKEYEQAKREHELEVEARMHENLNKLCGETEITEEDIERDARELESYLQEPDMEAAIAETEESIATEEAKEIVERMEQEERKEREKKVRKERKAKAAKKNAAYVFSNGGVEFTLTAKQVDFIRHLPDTYFWENGVDSEIWIDCLCDDIKGQFEGKPMTVGAMISTLCEKGLGTRATSRRDNRKCTSFALTPWGKAVAKDLGLR